MRNRVTAAHKGLLIGSYRGPWTPRLNWPLARNGPQGQLNGPRKFARATFSCQGRLRGKAPHPDKKMWAWQIFLAHLVGPGPFLASGQLSLVVRGGRDNE